MRWFSKWLCYGRDRPFSYVPAIEELDRRCLLSSGFVQSNLIADVPGLAQVTDPAVLNPWGLANSPAGPFVFADNNSGMATGNSTVVVPVGVPGLSGIGSPTGEVFNPGSGFVIAQGGNAAPSLLLFASEDGAIFGWNPRVNAGQAIVAVNNSVQPGNGPIYTGLTLASNAQGAYLFAANFRSGAIDIFDKEFHPISWADAFTDPALPAGYVPFNIQAIGSYLYVMYTQQNGGRYDVSTGHGNGVVDVFNTQGQFVQRLLSQGPLNAPWGVAMAPSNFGAFGNDLLVGNFGDGRINAFDSHSGAFLGPLTDTLGSPIRIPGLWSLQFGNDAGAGSSNSLFFTAGVGAENHGLFGSLQPSGPGVAPSLKFASQQRILDAIENDSYGQDNYPIPPAQGPALHETAPSANQSRFASILPSDSPFAVVPALAAPAQTNLTLAASAWPAAQAGPTVFVSYQGQTFPSFGGAPALTTEITAAGPTNRRKLDPLPGSDVMVDLYVQRILPASETGSPGAGIAQDQIQQEMVPPNQAETEHLSSALLQTLTHLPDSIGASKDPVQRSDHLFVYWIPHAILMMVVAGCGVHLAKANPFEPHIGMLARLRGLCSKFRTGFFSTSKVTSVLAGRSEPAAVRELVVTSVIEAPSATSRA